MPNEMKKTLSRRNFLASATAAVPLGMMGSQLAPAAAAPAKRKAKTNQKASAFVCDTPDEQ